YLGYDIGGGAAESLYFQPNTDYLSTCLRS
ncbi:unnamed protein product, partial [marine sediment metagenome]